MADVKASFILDTQSNAEEILKKDALAAQAYQDEIDSLKRKNEELAKIQKRLVGSSAEVKDARQKIGAQMKANTSDVGRLSLAQISAEKREGQTLEEGRAKAKSVADSEAKAATEAAAAQKAADAEKAKSEKTSAETKAKNEAFFTDAHKRQASSQADADIASFKKSAGAVLGVVGPIAAVGAAVLASSIALGGWLVSLANGARNLRLQREALLGSAQQAEVLDQWQQKLVQSTGQSEQTISGFADTLGKARLQGKEYTAALEASTMAQAAMGDTLSSKVQELTTRQARLGVFTLGKFELDGTGLQTADVAAALAKNTNVSLASAQKSLMSGRLPLVKGAEAIRDAIKLKFGKNIAEKAISIDSLENKAKAKLGQFAKGIKIDGLLRQADRLLMIFDANTTTGKKFLGAVNTSVEILTKGAEFVVPKLTDGFELGGLAVALIENKTVQLYLAVQDAGDEFDRIVASTKDIAKSIETAVSSALGFGEAGENVAHGIAKGLRSGQGDVHKAGGELYEAAHKGFAAAGDIHSPSREAATLAENVPAGTVVGLERGASRVSEAGARLGDAALPSPGAGSGGGFGGGGSVTQNIVLNLTLPSIREPKDFEKPEFKQAVSRVLREMAGQGASS